MPTATLSAPLTLNPAQATTATLRELYADGGSITVVVDLFDGTGKPVGQERVTLNDAAAAAWLAAQRPAVLQLWMAQRKLAGVVA